MYCFSFSGTRSIIFGTLKIGQNDPEIPNLEFENHGFLENQVFLPTEQAGTNICWMIYQDTNFKICLSLFGWKENILPKLHILHCDELANYHDLQTAAVHLNASGTKSGRTNHGGQKSRQMFQKQTLNFFLIVWVKYEKDANRSQNHS